MAEAGRQRLLSKSKASSAGSEKPFVLSSDPCSARREMFGLIFYLTTFGYIDGEFDPNETAYIRATIERVLERWILDAAGSDDREQVRARLRQDVDFFHDLFDAVQREVTDLLETSVIEAERMHVFLGCKLKQRCFEIFRSFPPAQQEQLLGAADELLMADGRAHPAEVSLRQELAEILEADVAPPPLREAPVPVPVSMKLDDRVALPRTPLAPAAFVPYEHTYSGDPKILKRQVAADRALIKRALAALGRQRKRGRGALRDVTRVDELSGLPPTLVGRVQLLMPRPDRRYEVTVVGDLHGCYSCLKAALIQSRFFERVAAFRESSDDRPVPLLVLLGDYIDRGRFSFDGVLRLLLQLQSTAPEHVILLRGNHESFVDDRGTVRSIVTPADALEAYRPLAPPALLRDYLRLFDALPTALLLGRTLFTHGGIPSDSVLRDRWAGLASLDDPVIRFQMLWSDPSIVDVIPRSLQDQLVRFSFGRLQCEAFLQQMGCHTLIRGHGQPATGFRQDARSDHLAILTVCSAGGPENRDIPEDCELRMVRPMAMTLRLEGGLDGAVEIDVWPIDYKPYNEPDRNGFYAE